MRRDLQQLMRFEMVRRVGLGVSTPIAKSSNAKQLKQQAARAKPAAKVTPRAATPILRLLPASGLGDLLKAKLRDADARKLALPGDVRKTRRQ